MTTALKIANRIALPYLLLGPLMRQGTIPPTITQNAVTTMIGTTAIPAALPSFPTELVPFAILVLTSFESVSFLLGVGVRGKLFDHDYSS